MSSQKNVLKPALFVLSVFVITLAVVGCHLASPEPPFSREKDLRPLIPPGIEQGEWQEPVISVYLAEEDIVEEMGLEEYIMGVVAGEMDPLWPLEALGAQAIIARTFTLQKIAERGGVPERNAHASTDIEEFQAYSAEDITARVKEAVRQTRGKVACQNKEFIRAWFHAYAGPKTALADEGLAFKENPPYIQIVESPGKTIISPEEGRWLFSFDLEEVREAVQKVTGNDPGEIQNIEIAEKGPSGRVTLFMINGQRIPAPELRLALGSTKMRSTFLTDMGLEDGKLTLAGEGYGHGVGLCQWGARALANEKRSPEEIVNYFYKDVEIVTLWD